MAGAQALRVASGPRAAFAPRAGGSSYARVDNVFDRRYETYAAVAEDLFPGGELARPHVAPVEKVRRVSSHRVPPAASWGCVCAGER